MGETTALDRHACPACGAQAEWTPAKQALVCPHCGTVAPAELDDRTGAVREIDLVQTLRELPDDARGWHAEKRSVRCRSCDAVSVFDPGRVGQNCDFCGSSELVDYDEIKAPIRPESLLPFRIAESRVRDALREWTGSKWLAPGDLKRRARTDTVRGAYLPYWTFDARARCPWTAESGTYYYTTRTYRDSRGRTRTRRVRKVRWRPAAGEVSHFFDDEPVPGTRGVDRKLLRRVEPFPTKELVPYDTRYLAGFLVEHYQVVLVEAARQARESMAEKLRRMCAAEVPGDTYRNLRIYPEYTGETFKHVLLPVWLLAYRYGGKPYQVLVNGVTGKIAGRYPKSVLKIALLLTAAVVVAAATFFLLR